MDMSVDFTVEIDQYLARLSERQEQVWPSEVSKEVSYPFGEQTMVGFLRGWAEERPDHPAIVFHGRALSYAELDRQSDRVAEFLLERITPGDRVAVLMPNLPQFVVAFFGILKAGCVHVPINPMFRHAEIRYELEDTAARLAFVLDDLAAELARAATGTALEGMVATSVRDALGEGDPLPFGAEESVAWPGAIRFTDVVTREPSGTLPEPDPDALAALNYTGGTTGMPKGCEHTQRDMAYTAVTGAVHNFGMDRDSVHLIYIPIFWIAGEDGFLLGFATGSTCALQYRWDARTALDTIERDGVTTLCGTVDNMLELLDTAATTGQSLAGIRTAATMSFVTKLTSDIRRRWARESGAPAVLRESSYGMTEDHTFDTFTRGLHDLDLSGRPGFTGLPMSGTQVAVVDFETGRLVPVGDEGQIIVRSPSMMRGYHRRDDATSETLRNGWLHTGDSGLVDENGCLHYLGRRKEMLKVNGMSVFPSELEFVLSRHPHIAASGVVGVADERTGERPLAFVELRPDSPGDLDAASIRAWCKENMASYKVPLVRILQAMPLAPTGKILKSALVDLATREP